MKKKIVALVLVFAIALALGIGGTMAWLTAESKSVVNTFTVGDVKVELSETDAEEKGNTLEKTYTGVVPGWSYPKDPTVKVDASSEACYVFVKIDEANNTLGNGKIIEYTVDNSIWTAGTKTDAVAGNGIPVGYYYCEAEASAEKAILLNNTVVVNEELTQTTVTAGNEPKLIFSAAAIQLYESNNVKMDVVKAFENLPATFKD